MCPCGTRCNKLNMGHCDHNLTLPKNVIILLSFKHSSIFLACLLRSYISRLLLFIYPSLSSLLFDPLYLLRSYIFIFLYHSLLTPPFFPNWCPPFPFLSSVFLHLSRLRVCLYLSSSTRTILLSLPPFSQQNLKRYVLELLCILFVNINRFTNDLI